MTRRPRCCGGPCAEPRCVSLGPATHPRRVSGRHWACRERGQCRPGWERPPRGQKRGHRARELRRIRLGVWAEDGASGVLTPAQRSLQGAVPVTHLSVQPVQTPTGASGPQACRVLRPLLQRPVSTDLMSSWTPPGRGHPLPGAHDAHVPRGLRRGVPSARPVCTETPSSAAGQPTEGDQGPPRATAHSPAVGGGSEGSEWPCWPVLLSVQAGW